MLFKLSNTNSNLALTVGYLNPALNNLAQDLQETGRWSFLFRQNENKPKTNNV